MLLNVIIEKFINVTILQLSVLPTIIEYLLDFTLYYIR